MYSLSAQGAGITRMTYLTREAATSPKLSSALRFFKQFSKISKELACINLILYKLSFPQKKRR